MKILKALLFSLLALVLIVVGAAALYLHIHPIPISNPRMLLHVALGRGQSELSPIDLAARLHAPAGFSVEVYANNLAGARMLHVTAAGDLIVSRPRAGEVDLLPHNPQDPSHALQRKILLQGLSKPHGLDVANGWLYVGETDAIGRVRFDESTGKLLGNYERIVTGLTGNGNHWSKTVRVGPDNYLYVAQGSTCNVCEEVDKRRATIMRFHLDGSGGEIYATGLRNSVGMDWAPWDQQLYATDNGRDLLGDNFPPCELNRIVQGGFYGWPYINGFGVLDPDMGNGKNNLLSTAISPAFGFRAHNAPLGMHFLQSEKLQKKFQRTALVALHGSWNRSAPDGYKVVALQWRDDGTIVSSDFLDGFENGGEIIGRPVDIAESVDGAIYISDDYAGVIYRVSDGDQSASVQESFSEPMRAREELFENLNADEKAKIFAQGEQLFQQYACASCHDAQQPAQTRRGPLLENLRARYTVPQLQEFFVAPAPPMPTFPLSADERRALAVYLLRQ